MAGTLHLSLLGPIRIGLGTDRLIHLPVRKEEALLAYLALEHRHAHSRDSLIGLLWPDAPADKARLSLRVNLSNLKKRLQGVDVDALFRITPLDIQFVADACHLDTVEFARCLRSRDGHDHPRDELCERCQPAFSRAVELSRGTFLDGLYLDSCQTFDEWLFMQRERFRVQLLDALEKLTAFHWRRGEDELALTHARRQLEIDPLREQAHLQIMQIHLAQGDRTGALRQYDRCRTVLRAELGVEPSGELRELQQQILAAPAQGVASAVSPIDAEIVPSQSQLPSYLTPFVGRQDELALVQQRLRSGDCRLITLVGPGGIGKTRLAVEAARQLSDPFADGVCFVPCAAVEDAAAVADTLAAALGIIFRAGSRTPPEQLIDWLRSRRVLLVVDNFEQLLPAAPLLLELLYAAPHVAMLVTSREALGVQAEDLVHLSGLPVPAPEPVAEAGHFPAVRLFVDRAYRIDKRFSLNPDNAADVARICRLVGGQPLALELAAAQTANHTCRTIADAIGADLEFLRAELPDLPARHQRLSAIFEYSWQALTPLEQSCFGRISVFCDPFSVEAASAVAGASLAVLTRLQKVHLLQRHLDGGRFSVHALLRQFAAAKLAESLPDPAPLQRRHAEYFLTWLSSHEQLLGGIQPLHHADLIQAQLDDVRFAWQWASGAGAVDLLQHALPVLGAFFTLRGMHSEGERLFRATWAQLGEEEEDLRAQLLVRLGSFLEKQGKRDAARTVLNEGLAIAQRRKIYQSVGLGLHTLARLDALARSASAAIQILKAGLATLPADEFLTVRAELLIYLGSLEAQQGNRSASISAYEEVRRIVARTGNKVQEQRLFMCQGVDSADDNIRAAQFYLERALALCPDTGDRTLETRILAALGFIHARLGDYEVALQYHLRGLAVCTADQDAIQQSYVLHNLCVDFCGLGRYEEAYYYAQEALAIAERNDLLDAIGYAQLHLGYVLGKLCLHQGAERALLTARDTFAQLERKPLAIEAEAGLAHVAQLTGDLPAALAHTNRVLTFLATQTLAGSDETTRIYLHCYQVLAACRDPRAGQILLDAYRYVQKHAVLLDPDARTRYLTAVAANREIMEIWEGCSQAIG